MLEKKDKLGTFFIKEEYKIIMKLTTCVIGKNQNKVVDPVRAQKNDMIDFISRHSSRYGDKLVDFMESYNLINLEEATVPQLQEYIATHLYNVQNQTQTSTPDRML